MLILIAGGTGFIGRKLVKALLTQGETVTVLGRSKMQIESVFGNKVEALEWNNLDSVNPDQFTAVINLCGRNISAFRWTATIKESILNSRITSTNQIAAWCAKAKNKPHLYNASATGIYGLQPISTTLPPQKTEQDPLPMQPTDFLSKVGSAWENAAKTAVNNGVPVTFMRFGVVLQSKGGALNAMKVPFQLGLGTRMGSGNQPFSWVHMDDVIAAIIFLLRHPGIVGPVNIVAPECVSQDVFARTFAEALRRPYYFVMPTWMVKLMMGEMGDELILNGQNVYPSRLLEAKFNFQYPALKSALEKEFAK